ncbi:MAG: beta-ketoacyl-ACP synthase III [Geminicoccaceae bacterium]
MSGGPSLIRGVGSYLPERIVTNDELAAWVDTSDAWIQERTGIKQRHIAASSELTSDLAAAAARAALDDADLTTDAIDLIVVATATPDNTFPATATAVQRKLAMGRAIAFDLQAVCAGFVYALATADSMLRAGVARRALVIGAETFSRILDWKDRGTCVLFGDGAGAIVLEAGDADATRGVLTTSLAADGKHYEQLYVDGGPSRGNGVGHLRMNGREVFRHAVAMLSDSVVEALDPLGLEVDAIDLLIPHQANKRIIDAVGKRLNLANDKVMVTVDRHANTSAASIPLALDEAKRRDLITDGKLIVVNAMGGGFTWGAAAIRW